MFGKLLLVLFVALGIGMAVPSTRAKMEAAAAPLMDGVKGKLATGRLEAMADQIEVRLKRGEGLPGNWALWLDRDFTGAAEDPWGNVYFLQGGRGSFTVGSKGPDGQENTDDDIKVTRQQPR